MLIELHGGQFANKGAQKMLVTTVRQLQRRIQGCTFVVDSCVGTREQRKNEGLAHFLISRGWMGSPQFKFGFAMQRMCSRLVEDLSFPVGEGVPLHKAQALVDLAGFAYSDQWGQRPVKDFASLAEFYSRRGKPVILLPQALGPFQKPSVRKAFQKVVKSADIIFARDRRSLKYAQDAAEGVGRIELAPDITLFERSSKDVEIPKNNNVFFVPNIRMIDKKNPFSSGQYLEVLLEAIGFVKELGANPVLLVHDDSGQDLRVARKVQALSKFNIDIVDINDPWELKSIVGKALAVVGSRYHALVASLSKGVPVAALGWSHKYEELLEDFGLSNYLLKDPSEKSRLADSVKAICEADSNLEIRQGIIKRLHALRARNESMWDAVVEKINRGCSG